MILLKSLHSEGLLSHDEGRRPLGFLGGGRERTFVVRFVANGPKNICENLIVLQIAYYQCIVGFSTKTEHPKQFANLPFPVLGIGICENRLFVGFLNI